MPVLQVHNIKVKIWGKAHIEKLKLEHCGKARGLRCEFVEDVRTREIEQRGSICASGSLPSRGI